MSRMLSGHPEGIKIIAPYKPAAGTPWTIATTDTLTAWSGTWGVSFAANLTPDKNTGLASGVWTEALFIKALRTGKHMGTSRDILPPMPWPLILAPPSPRPSGLFGISAHLKTIRGRFPFHLRP